MDVTGWTIEQLSKLPEWCYGNRAVIGISMLCPLAATRYYGISEIALPDPCCIWQFGWWYKTNVIAGSTIRLGLRATVPTSGAEMDDATELFPYMGYPHAGPNEIFMTTRESIPFVINTKIAMVTGGLKLVCTSYSDVVESHFNCFLIVSGLPTDMAGWLAHGLV